MNPPLGSGIPNVPESLHILTRGKGGLARRPFHGTLGPVHGVGQSITQSDALRPGLEDTWSCEL